MAAIPAYDTATQLTASGQTHTGGVGASLGFLVSHLVTADFTSPTWGGRPMTLVKTTSQTYNLAIWAVNGDLHGAQAIAWAGSPVANQWWASTYIRAGWIDATTWAEGYASATGEKINVTPANINQLVVAWAYKQSAISSTPTAYGTNCTLQAGYAAMNGNYKYADSMQNDTGSPREVGVQSAQTGGTVVAGVAIKLPLAGNQVIWF